ncbi:DNA-3-methyladenine glycosylase I [Candidatus Gracilibacteria bacterium]|nr:DNA-3-methyladenine glycosylase I [Candidatus Gracilibacteria bacterium]
MNTIHRCGWVNMKNPLYISYHDTEWGKPVYDDQKLFELICLEGAQAGLSWETILNRRVAYREMFWNFDIDQILAFTDEELLERMPHFNVIKNKLKITGVRKNALAFQKIIEEHGSFARYIWSFVDGQTITNNWVTFRECPPYTDISENMRKSLKKYGFTFVGPTICYAFMQAAGLVNDHETGCSCR